MKLASFDIFDTTLIRRCGGPEIVHEVMACRLWPESAMRRAEFLNLRRQAVSCLTLTEIYAVPGMALFPEYTAEQLMQAEMNVESDMLTVNPIVKMKIEEMRDEGWTIKFLSDMYLPSEFLTKVLRREGCLHVGEEVIVSCEWDARKDTGELYRKVREKYSPTKWMHFGDNRRSDCYMARKNGLKATIVDFGFTMIEKRLIAEGKKLRDGWRMSLLAGVSRTERVKASLDPKATLAADFVAAVYVPYVVWLLRSTRKAGIKRLHFLSRDGYIMMKIAEVIAPDDIELNYLFVSRKALMRAYLAKGECAERFIEVSDRKSLIGRSVNHLLSQLQLSRKGLKEQYGIDFNFNKILNNDQQEDFLNKIFRNGEFTRNLMADFAKDSDITEKYLLQEGLYDGTEQAMVDIGWLGTSRLMINQILSTDIPTYYVSVRGDVYDRSYGDFDAYFTSGQLDTTATGLIETYYSASPWPSTMGYEQTEIGKIIPRFADRKDFKETALTRANVQTCQAIAKELKPYLGCFDDDLLFRWAKISLDSIVNMSDNIDLSPLTDGCDFDGVAMAHRLNPLELLNFTFAGARYTAFDRASIRLTLGSRLDRPVWSIHQHTSRLRTRLYQYLLKRR